MIELKKVEELLGEVFYPLWLENVYVQYPQRIIEETISVWSEPFLISGAFMWNESPQKEEFWRELHYMLTSGKPINLTRLQITEAFDKLLGRTPLWEVYHLGKYIGTTSGNSIEELSIPNVNGYYNDDIDFFMADLNDFEIENFSFKPSVARYQTWENVFDVFTHIHKNNRNNTRMLLNRRLSEVITLGTHLYSLLLYTEIEQD